jgi:hypothetical protein
MVASLLDETGGQAAYAKQMQTRGHGRGLAVQSELNFCLGMLTGGAEMENEQETGPMSQPACEVSLTSRLVYSTRITKRSQSFLKGMRCIIKFSVFYFPIKKQEIN